MSETTAAQRGPHPAGPPLTAGDPLDRARAVMIMIHGRGGSATDIISLADHLSVPGFVFLAPQASGHTWYPHPFVAPLERNEPFLSSALATIERLLADLAEAGVAAERTILLGFSQGACLALEYAARHARRYGGLVGLSGGLIGPDGTPRDYPGSLAGTPVFLGCSDIDTHIPIGRVHESAEVLRALGGDVDVRIYPGMGHTIDPDEIAAVQAMMIALVPPTE